MIISIICAGFLIGGCTGVNQTQFALQHSVISLEAGDLEVGGIGFLTPAAATGREGDKQALALSFSDQLKEMIPDAKVVPLPIILSKVNAADLDQEYRGMYRDYLETGILEGSVLYSVGTVGGVRYLAQLSLSGFVQGEQRRLGVLGLRLLDTEKANLRVFVQIWDIENAGVAWEGGVELNHAYETGKEKPVTFYDVAQLAAEQLFLQLPGAQIEEK